MTQRNPGEIQSEGEKTKGLLCLSGSFPSPRVSGGKKIGYERNRKETQTVQLKESSGGDRSIKGDPSAACRRYGLQQYPASNDAP